jgi:hydroxymethylbilane synthase
VPLGGAGTRTLRLGTRRSALARAQSSQVAAALEALHPGLKVELVGIDTRGDRIVDRPLREVEGKAFFTAEIDSALESGQVDFTVHSYKDLSLERPAALTLAAVPRRQWPHDIALFAPDTLARRAAGEALIVGSSSPRRAAFVPEFLRRALPCGAGDVLLSDLRGNVDTRLRRLREPVGAARRLDAVVLSLAGLARLWRDDSGRRLLEELLEGVPRMLLPLSQCPTAPAQGALAIECRTADADTLQLLRALDDPATRRALTAERALLAERGGGCHQRFGATQVEVPGLGTLLYRREAREREQAQPPRLEWVPEPALEPAGAVTAWDGSRVDKPQYEMIEGGVTQAARALPNAPAAFIAHRRALPALSAQRVNACLHLWVPGVETWFALAALGLWIEGCADGLGLNSLQGLLAEPLLALPPAPRWTVLTHEGATGGYEVGEVIATYRHVPGDTGARAQIAAASHLFWSSRAQFDRWHLVARRDAHHACGPGKTYDYLRTLTLPQLRAFPSAEQWREWIAA